MFLSSSLSLSLSLCLLESRIRDLYFLSKPLFSGRFALTSPSLQEKWKLHKKGFREIIQL